MSRQKGSKNKPKTNQVTGTVPEIKATVAPQKEFVEYKENFESKLLNARLKLDRAEKVHRQFPTMTFLDCMLKEKE